MDSDHAFCGWQADFMLSWTLKVPPPTSSSSSDRSGPLEMMSLVDTWWFRFSYLMLLWASSRTKRKLYDYLWGWSTNGVQSESKYKIVNECLSFYCFLNTFSPSFFFFFGPFSWGPPWIVLCILYSRGTLFFNNHPSNFEMMLSSQLLTSIVFTASIFMPVGFKSLVEASSLSTIRRESKIVFSPHITSPTSEAIWPMGSVQNVTWGTIQAFSFTDTILTIFLVLVETADLPSEKREDTGIVMLGYLEDGNEHLDIRQFLSVLVLRSRFNPNCKNLSFAGHPLATGFRIDQGHVLITVPRRIAERNDYICVGEPLMQKAANGTHWIRIGFLPLVFGDSVSWFFDECQVRLWLIIRKGNISQKFKIIKGHH